MQRYHTTGMGEGIGKTMEECYESRTAHDYSKTMFASDFGYWVKYDAAVANACSEFSAGLAQGRKEGQVKVDALKDLACAELHEQTEAAFDRGFAAGAVTDDDSDTAEYNRGYHDGFMVWSTTGRPVQASDDIRKLDAGQDVAVLDTRTNQLLNELYHDRARLEKVVKDIASTAKHTAADIAALMEQLYPDGIAPMTQATVDVTIDAGMLRQFADTHGE